MELTMNALTQINEAAPTARAMWMSFAESVRADAVTEQTPEFLASGLSFADFLHDECFVCPILGHHFLFADGIEIDGVWVHQDSDLIGHDDAAFKYGVL
jgi:hypothetical protein